MPRTTRRGDYPRATALGGMEHLRLRAPSLLWCIRPPLRESGGGGRTACLPSPLHWRVRPASSKVADDRPTRMSLDGSLPDSKTPTRTRVTRQGLLDSDWASTCGVHVTTRLGYSSSSTRTVPCPIPRPRSDPAGTVRLEIPQRFHRPATPNPTARFHRTESLEIPFALLMHHQAEAAALNRAACSPVRVLSSLLTAPAAGCRTARPTSGTPRAR
jgi:hypothetical protein